MRAFSDLRLNAAAGQNDESFWPSFTDIMMVVVMIFLISSSVLIMRNWELIRQITETAEAEREAAEQARISIAENATLEERLVATEQQLQMTRLQLLRSLEQKARAQRLLEREQARNEALGRERGALENLLAGATSRSEQLTAELGSTRAQLSQSQQQVSSNRDQLVLTEQRLASTSDELAEARRELAATRGALAGVQRELTAAQRELSDAGGRYGLLHEQLQRSADLLAQRQSELAEAQSQIEILGAERERSDAELGAAAEREVLTEERLEELRAEYRVLKAKYDKLVRPARTTKGKYVVSLRYSGIDGERIIQLREPGDDVFRRLSEAQMHSQLGALKKRFGGELYIRIIFPEDSQLTYNEAWSFTTDILNQYDYYYQGGGEPTLEELPAGESPTGVEAAE